MGSEAALGKAVLELATDDTKFNAGLAEATAKGASLGQSFGQAGAQATTFGERLANLGKQAGLAGAASKILESSLGQFTVAGLATQAITGFVGAIGTLITKGTQLPAIRGSFEALTGAMKINAATMLGEMRRGTDSLVSDLDLMQSANKALLLGLPVTSKTMGELATTARVLGKAMGQDATKSLDDLITALGRSSPMILDNLGLTVKVGEANDAYAAKLGKSADALTDGEKKLAFYEAAMEAARKKTQALGEQTKTLGEIATTVWTQVGNVITETAATINVGLGASLTSGKGFVDFLDDVIKRGPAVAIQFAAIREQIKALDAQRKAGLGKDVNLETYESSLAKVRASITSTVATIIPLNATQRELALQLDKTGLAADKIAEKLNQVQGWKVTEQAVKNTIEAHKQAADAAKQQATAVDTLTDKYTGQKKAVDEMAAAMKRMKPGDDWKGLAEQIGKMASEGARLTPEMTQLAIRFGTLTPAVKLGADAFDNLGFKIDATIPKLSEFNQAVLDLQSKTKIGFEGLGDVGLKVSDGFDEAAKKMEKAARLEATVLSDLSAAFDLLAGSSNRALAGLGGIMGSVAQAMRVSATSMKEWGNSAGVAAPLFNSTATATEKWAAAMSSSATIAAGAMDVWTATSGNAAKAANTLNGAMAGAKAGAAFGPYGVAIGAAAGAVVGLVKALTAGRKEVENFAQSMGGFDALQAKLLDTLGKTGEQLWIKLTQGVKKGDKAGADRVIAEIQAALANAPAALAAAAGYQTREELQAVADKAKQVYDFMVASGKYTASQIGDAFEKMQAAQDAAMDDATKRARDASKAAKDAAQKDLDELDGKIKSLKDSIAGEAPEEVMGIVEAQARAQIDALEKQREAAAATMETLNKNTADGLNDVAEALKNLPDEIRVRVELDYRENGKPGSSSSGSSEPPPSAVPMAAGGFGRVTRPTLFYSKGSEDYAFSGEGRSFGLSKLASRPIEITNVTELDGRVVARNQVRYTPNELSRVGIRSR